MKPVLLASLFAVAVVGVTACSDSSSDNYGLGPAPPSIDFRAVSLDSGGVLKINVTVSNPSSVHLQVSNAPECPFDVRIFADSTGQAMVGFGTILGATCPSSAKTTDLAPRDSLILTRTFSATDLTQDSPGLYGINVTVGSNTVIVTGWGGAVRLPLSSKP